MKCVYCVKADIREVEEAMNSAVRVTESIASHVQNFIPKVPFPLSSSTKVDFFFIFNL